MTAAWVCDWCSHPWLGEDIPDPSEVCDQCGGDLIPDPDNGLEP